MGRLLLYDGTYLLDIRKNKLSPISNPKAVIQKVFDEYGFDIDNIVHKTDVLGLRLISMSDQSDNNAYVLVKTDKIKKVSNIATRGVYKIIVSEDNEKWLKYYNKDVFNYAAEANEILAKDYNNITREEKKSFNLLKKTCKEVKKIDSVNNDSIRSILIKLDKDDSVNAIYERIQNDKLNSRFYPKVNVDYDNITISEINSDLKNVVINIIDSQMGLKNTLKEF